MSEKRLLQLRRGDNVLIATTPIAAGTVLEIDGRACVSDQDIGIGFKVAAQDLAAGEAVIRLGMPVGEITTAVGRGNLVHVHNMKSRYLRTHERGES